MTVELGFVEKCEPWLLESRFFPLKVGGKPAWLDLKNIPGKGELECEYCGDPCVFLCQVYAPYEDNELAFHRTVFVFICKKAECCRLNESGNLKVLRSQLPKVNQFYSSEPPVEAKDWRTDITAEKWVKTCHVCGILAPSHCSQCKGINYCCRSHQVYDWKNGHKEVCGTATTKRSNFLFPEYELIIETEDEKKEDSDADNSECEEEEIEKYNAMTESGEAGTFQKEDVQNELLAMANSKEDETFAQFRTTVDKYPDQVLRYKRGGEVLYISSQSKVETIPRCLQCNGERQLEFQVMPQLLNFLELDNALKCIDWGVLAIFTCINSCIPMKGYAAEYIWKQDIVESPYVQ